MSINRKLIRPDMSAARQAVSDKRKKAPPVETAAEAFYDESAIKLHRRGAPNLLLMKHAIKYMHKEGDMGTLDETPEE